LKAVTAQISGRGVRIRILSRKFGLSVRDSPRMTRASVPFVQNAKGRLIGRNVSRGAHISNEIASAGENSNFVNLCLGRFQPKRAKKQLCKNPVHQWKIACKYNN